MTVGSLFSGIGGFDLGFERAGFEIKWQVEIDPFCRQVLAKHWPNVRRYEDVRTVGIELAPVDVICGGFPCQPHSLAGRRGGSTDERDLWPQFARLIRELKPRWVVAENVPGLLSSDAGRFFGTVLGDLAESGYDAEWDCISAADVGAPHLRERIWIVAYPDGGARQQNAIHGEWTERRNAGPEKRGEDVADADQSRLQGRLEAELRECAGERATRSSDSSMADAEREHDDDWGFGAGAIRWQFFQSSNLCTSEQWRVEPDVGRVAHGVSARVDRLRGLGNAIVPQIAEWIARRILETEGVSVAG